MRRQPVGLDARAADLNAANAHLADVAARWLTARAGGRVPEPLDLEARDAEQACRAAQRRLDQTRKRLAHAPDPRQ